MKAGDVWSVVWAASAARAMSRLPIRTVEAVAAFVEGPLKDNPKRLSKALHEPFKGQRSARVGTAYRVIFELDEAGRLISIVAVSHRSDAYRSRQGPA